MTRSFTGATCSVGVLRCGAVRCATWRHALSDRIAHTHYRAVSRKLGDTQTHRRTAGGHSTRLEERLASHAAQRSEGGVPRARRRARGISGSARSDYESRGSALALASLISRRPPLASPNLSLNSLTHSLHFSSSLARRLHSTLLSVLYSSRHTVRPSKGQTDRVAAASAARASLEVGVLVESLAPSRPNPFRSLRALVFPFACEPTGTRANFLVRAVSRASDLSVDSRHSAAEARAQV